MLACCEDEGEAFSSGIILNSGKENNEIDKKGEYLSKKSRQIRVSKIREGCPSSSCRSEWRLKAVRGENGDFSHCRRKSHISSGDV